MVTNPNPVNLPTYDSVEAMDAPPPVNKAAARSRLSRDFARFRRANVAARRAMDRLTEAHAEAGRLDEQVRRQELADNLDGAAFYAAELGGKYLELARVAYRATAAYRELGALMEQAGDGS